MIAQGFVLTREFLTERNSRAYFRAKKIPCGNKEQARARIAGEKCGLDTCGGKPHIAGTRIRVQDNVIMTEQGQSTDDSTRIQRALS